MLHTSHKCPADSPQEPYKHWEAGVFGAEATWWKWCRREKDSTHGPGSPCSAPCPPPQSPHLPRAAPKLGTKTGQGVLQWPSISRAVRLGALAEYTLCMHPLNANSVYDPAGTYSEKSSHQKCNGWHPDRTKHAFVLKSHPKNHRNQPHSEI